MDWYKREPAVFELDTIGLPPFEYGCYNRLVDNYYIAEKPLRDDDEWLAGVCRCPLDEWLRAKPRVMKFFTFNPGKTDVGSNGKPAGFWTHDKCERVIAKFRKKGDVARVNGKKGGRPRKPEEAEIKGKEPSHNPEVTQPKPTPNPGKTRERERENPESSVPTDSGRRKGTRLAKDWQETSQDRAFAKGAGLSPDETAVELEKFRVYYTEGDGRNKTHANWPRAWQGWVRNAIAFAGRRGGRPRPGPASAAAVAASSDPERVKADVDLWGKP